MTRAARINSGSLVSEAWKAWAVPWKLPRMLAGSPSFWVVASMACTASPREAPGARLNDRVVAGKLPLVADDQGAGGLFDPGDGAQRHLAAAGAADIDGLQLAGVLLKVGLDLQDDAVLVQLGEDGGHLALAEGVVEGVIDELRGDAQPRGRGAVDGQEDLQPLVLLIAAHVPQFRQFLEGCDQPGGPAVQFVGVGVLEAVLVLGPADPVLHRQVLHRLHEERDALELGELAAAGGG